MSEQSARGQFGIGEVLAQLQPEFPDISTSKIRFLEAEAPNDYAACVNATTASGSRTFMIVKSGAATGDVKQGGEASLHAGGVDEQDRKIVGISAAQKTIKSFWPYSTTIFDFVRRAMPFTAPRSLSDDEVYALTAYILAENKLIDAKETMNAETLPKVKMPNRDNFIIRFPDRI